MINNYYMIREAELEYHLRQNSSVDRNLELMGEMMAFANEFRKSNITLGGSPHVRNLIHLAGQMKKIQNSKAKTQNNA